MRDGKNMIKIGYFNPISRMCYYNPVSTPISQVCFYNGTKGDKIISEGEKAMEVKDIIIKYLRDNSYDGLCNPDIECACGIEDPYCCNCDGILNCQPAYKNICMPELIKKMVHDGICICSDGKCYQLNKPEAK